MLQARLTLCMEVPSCRGDTPNCDDEFLSELLFVFGWGLCLPVKNWL